MPFVYPTVLISSQPYSVYGDLPDALLYLNASVTAGTFLGSTEVVQSQLLVSAVRWLESAGWVGSKSDSSNELMWPRTSVSYADGTPVDSATIPMLVANAEFELAAALADDNDLRNTLQSPIPRELAAGSVNISFFRPIGASYGAMDVQVITPFPQNVMSLIGQWLAGQGVAGAPIATGDREKAEINRPLDFEHGI